MVGRRRRRLNEYYNCEWWKEFRKEVLQERPFCEKCGISKKLAARNGTPLQLHHKSYDHLGHEDEDDVEVLCLECHQIYHKRLFK